MSSKEDAALLAWLSGAPRLEARRTRSEKCASQLQRVADLETSPSILTVPGCGFVHIDDITDRHEAIIMETPEADLARYYCKTIKRAGVQRDRLVRLGMDAAEGVVLPGTGTFTALDRLSQSELEMLEKASDRILCRAYAAVTGRVVAPPRDHGRPVRMFTPQPGSVRIAGIGQLI